MHQLPLWFLVLSLFLPRLALFIGWINYWRFLVAQPWAALLWVFLPRVLVMMLIYRHQGFSVWFFIHLAVAVIVWCGGGSRVASRGHG